jgi:hypothetical protein
MIDALLFATRNSIRKAGFGYGVAECEIIDPPGKPPPRAGNIFVAVCQLAVTSTSVRNLDELYGFSLVLSMRVAVPLDRVGDQLLASQLARKAGPGNPSFNARVEQLRSWGHMNWVLMAAANNMLLDIAPPNAENIYGFVTPAQLRSVETAQLVGPDWFGAEPESGKTGIKAEIRFENSRRMQAETEAVGPYV